MKITGGDILVLFISDLARTRDFYENKLGMEYVHGDERSAVYSTDNGVLLMLDHEGADDLLGSEHVDHERQTGAHGVIVAGVEDVDSAYAELTSLGVEFVRPPEDRAWGKRTAHFRDPDGHIFELNHDL
ncbi:MAG TPA: VOC family protein [Acidimicrobiales bacterium]|nr:VOC family protein [Acidimicrobiales bacterium]